jgi:hypothetical protein
MAQGSVTPSSLFGPSGAAAAERGRLDATLRRVGQVCSALESGQQTTDPARVLSELRVDLELHFALEEADGHFGAIVRERPGLAHGIEALRSEHTALLVRLDLLREKLGDGMRRTKLLGAIIELVEALCAHEHRESALVQELILRDDGTGAD